MKKNILSYGIMAAIIFSPAVTSAQKAPAPYGAIPAERQLKWQEMEMYALMHFTPTTFQNKEWGFGDADPAIFNPVNFDASAIVNAVKAGGFKGLTLVAKHHDGFCLWPTKTTEYNISKSPFRNGKGDLVKEMMEACQKATLKFGLYCSPWDRNNEYYSKPEYISKVYYPQLNELYSNYGKLFTVFFDGANGGDGYYGGSREKRKIDASAYYNFDKIWEIVRIKQPGANIFSDIGLDLRWVGNEKGKAAETSWATFTPISPDPTRKPAPGFVVDSELEGGTRGGKYWIPAECDVPLRPGWFYHADQDNKVKTPAQLMDLYYQSVGRGASLDLGIAPMPDGRLHPTDINNLKRFGDHLKKTFTVNLAKGASVKASNTRANHSTFAAEKLIDNDRYSYWATNDDVTNAEVIFQFKKAVKFNVIRIRENIKLGQRVEAIEIDRWNNNQWETIGSATSIGGNRLIKLPITVSSVKIRLRVTKSPVCIALSDFGLFLEPDDLETSPVAEPLAKNTASKKLKLSDPSANAIIDGKAETMWTAAQGQPAQITIDLETTSTINSFTYLPRQDKNKAGLIDQYILYTSLDGINWNKVAEGEFSNIVNNPVLQKISLPANTQARYIRFEAKRTVDGSPATIAEISLGAS